MGGIVCGIDLDARFGRSPRGCGFGCPESSRNCAAPTCSSGRGAAVSADEALSARVAFLVRVVRREVGHLAETDRRLFVQAFTAHRASDLATNADEAERTEAFVARFSRLQDTVGDKLIPALLRGLGEPVGPVIDNLDRAERFGWISSTSEWLAARQLRNRMIHEYVEDSVVLADSLNQGHVLVPKLIRAAEACCAEAKRRGWAG